MCILASLGTGRFAAGELTSEECLVIYNRQSRSSAELAQYYAMKRQIPVERLLGLALPVAEDIPREQYEATVPQAVQAFLSEHEWGEGVRCLVTCYDVPLRVGAYHASSEEHALADKLGVRLAGTFRRLRTLIGEIGGADAESSGEGVSGTAASSTELGQAHDRVALEKLFDAYTAGMRELADSHEGLKGTALKNARRRLFRFALRAEGLSGLIRRAPEEGDDVSPNTAIRLRAIRARAAAEKHRVQRLTAYGSTSREFDKGLAVLGELQGHFGVAAALQRRIASLRGEDSESSFDSELSLVLWGRYDPCGWQPNELRAEGPQTESSGEGRRTLMVARLDGPSPSVVRRMIDDAIAVERNGLKGTFYIDARGLEEGRGHLPYDLDLRTLAARVRARTDLPVVLDNQSGVFSAGDRPNAALYCGWYSLANYVDAFEFVPGAVAVHMASFELVSLRNTAKRYWCKELLADGVAVTFGATSEPYLESFPKPTAFFSLVLSGRHTIVEAFYAAKPFNSWRLSLLGDPLYNPFKNNPQPIPRSEDGER
jgi:uncharacterized protein (TIGR03790 family)